MKKLLIKIILILFSIVIAYFIVILLLYYINKKFILFPFYLYEDYAVATMLICIYIIAIIIFNELNNLKN